jgi:hypothetical protein
MAHSTVAALHLLLGIAVAESKLVVLAEDTSDFSDWLESILFMPYAPLHCVAARSSAVAAVMRQVQLLLTPRRPLRAVHSVRGLYVYVHKQPLAGC